MMSNKPTILMLAHDLTDAAIAKRVQMLQDGGAAILVAGFRRARRPVETVCGHAATNMGRTRNGTFGQRAVMVLRTVAGIKKYRHLFAQADIIVARNLEMLAIAVAGACLQRRAPVIIYEVLDIHRMLLGKIVTGRILRWLERRLLRHTQGILTSSPSYVTEYFGKLNATALPIRVVENKLLQSPADRPDLRPASRQPWVIGWFGIIRCKKSLHILANLVRENAGQLEVVIGGRPALDQIPEFHEVVAATPGISFNGPYKNPEDLPALYGPVHFNWTIDMYEEGLNSSWLLPNRLYEGGFYNAVPLAIENVETGRYLKELGIGVLLFPSLIASLKEFFATLTPDHYSRLSDGMKGVPRSQWSCDPEDCKNLVTFMAGLAPQERGERP